MFCNFELLLIKYLIKNLIIDKQSDYTNEANKCLYQTQIMWKNKVNLCANDFSKSHFLFPVKEDRLHTCHFLELKAWNICKSSRRLHGSCQPSITNCFPIISSMNRNAVYLCLTNIFLKLYINECVQKMSYAETMCLFVRQYHFWYDTGFDVSLLSSFARCKLTKRHQVVNHCRSISISISEQK